WSPRRMRAALWPVGRSDLCTRRPQPLRPAVITWWRRASKREEHVRNRASLWSVLNEVREAVDVPVVAAGGVGSAPAVAAAFAAGADAVRIGTRFVAAVEADTHPDYAAALVAASAADTELTTAFSVEWPDAPHRVLRCSIEAARALDGDV